MNTKINIKCNPINGFAGETILAGEEGNMIVSGFFTSDDKRFFKYMKSIEKHFGFQGADFFSNFVIVIKPDFNCEVYFLNNMKISFTFNVDKKKGEPCFKHEVSGIGEVSLDEFNIGEKDGIIFCFKKNWKFGLYFDFSSLYPSSSNKVNVKELSNKLGRAYTILFFDEELDYIKNNQIYNTILKDGWFPFYAILDDYNQIYDFYEVGKINNDIFDKIIEKFNTDKLDKMLKRWFSNGIFKTKEDILRAGIEAYLLHSKTGYINCLNTLGLQIEGLLYEYYFGKTGDYNNYNQIIQYLKNKIGTSRKSNLLTIGFNEKFIDYLLNHVFGKFDLKTGKLDFSRHTIGHGVAKTEDYNKYRAFQYILILDQLYYYFIEK